MSTPLRLARIHLFLLLLLLLLLPQALCSPPPSYHTTSALLSALQSAARSCPHGRAEWASLTPTSPSPTSPHLLVITLSHNLRHLPPSALVSRPALLAVFGEHGRERITSELALHIIRAHCASPPPILSRARLVILPLVNPSGRRAAESGSPCARGNARGVDLNRNYLRRWGGRDARTRADEERAGAGPLSEAETRVVDGVAGLVAARAYVSVHSGGLGVVAPWDAGGGAASARLRAGARRVRDRHCAGCAAGTAHEVFGYRAYGTGADHFAGPRGLAVVYTLEVWADARAGDSDCARAFNPRDPRDVARNWTGALATVAEQLVAGGARAPRAWPGGVHGVMLEDARARGAHAWRVAAGAAALTGVALAAARRGRRRLSAGRCGKVFCLQIMYT